MGFERSEFRGSASDDQINSKYKSLLSKYLTSAEPKPAKTVTESKRPVKKKPYSAILEEMDELQDAIETPPTSPLDQSTDEPDEKELLDELNKLFTPVLVMQGYEQDIADQANEELSEAGVLTERNIISFDDETRMSQLISVCAKLIAKKKNTEAWQTFQKASILKKQASLNIQKEEYDKAKDLAQKFLVTVSTTGTSSVARDAARQLLPQTNH